MKVVIQRVSRAAVTINNSIRGSINKGLLVLAGIEDSDTQIDVDWLSAKIVNLRIFDDSDGVMNLSLKDCDGELLLVSQFTLQASTKKGNRPSYLKASKPPVAVPIYEAMISTIEKELGKPVATGVFGADMKVEIVNEGPVTIVIDSKNKE